MGLPNNIVPQKTVWKFLYKQSMPPPYNPEIVFIPKTLNLMFTHTKKTCTNMYIFCSFICNRQELENPGTFTSKSLNKGWQSIPQIITQ